MEQKHLASDEKHTAGEGDAMVPINSVNNKREEDNAQPRYRCEWRPATPRRPAKNKIRGCCYIFLQPRRPSPNVSRVFIAEIAEFGDVINAVNRLRNSETKNIFREQRGLGFISPKQPAIQIAEEKIEREPKQGCIGKGDDKSTSPERIDYGLRRFMMRLAHGSSTSGRRSLGRVALRRDSLFTFADDEHGVDFH